MPKNELIDNRHTVRSLIVIFWHMKAGYILMFSNRIFITFVLFLFSRFQTHSQAYKISSVIIIRSDLLEIKWQKKTE